MTDHPDDEGWLSVGTCHQGCHVRVVIPVEGGPENVVSDLTPAGARTLASWLLELANKVEGHPENAAERSN